MKVSEITLSQMIDIIIISRVTSALSLIGALFIAVTFLFSRHFQRPINRLVFYASMGNAFTNVATIISRDAVRNPTGVLCHTQAFLIQMFMSADAFWTLAMATNVWLTFYHRYDAARLRALEKWYFLLCYGVPFVPALVFEFLSTPARGRVYDNATLWCWIGGKWEVLRLACFYAPIWLVICVTCGIYIRAGKDIYKKRRQLRTFNNFSSKESSIDPFQSVKTTDFFITTETVDSHSTPDLHQVVHNRSLSDTPSYPERTYQVTVTSQRAQSHDRYSNRENPMNGNQMSSRSESRIPLHVHNRPVLMRRNVSMEASNAALAYTKVALLFFIAMMITWIPSSANRVYSVVHDGEISLALQFTSAFVLPLQGFWNAVIYATTSLPACKMMWNDIKSGRLSRNGLNNITRAFGDDKELGFGGKRSTKIVSGGKHSLETDSMTELQVSRPSTRGSNARS